MSQFSFPVLGDDELLPCLEEMDLPLGAQELAKPTYEIVRPLFESIVTGLTGVPRCAPAAGGHHAARRRECRTWAAARPQGGAQPAGVRGHRRVRVPGAP
jgi:hypothetical protein